MNDIAKAVATFVIIIILTSTVHWSLHVLYTMWCAPHNLKGMINTDGEPKYPGGYPDYMINHQRRPGIGPLAGWRGNGNEHGFGPPNKDQLKKYIKNRGSIVSYFWFSSSLISGNRDSAD